jgi:hypothetical protein
MKNEFFWVKKFLINCFSHQISVKGSQELVVNFWLQFVFNLKLSQNKSWDKKSFLKFLKKCIKKVLTKKLFKQLIKV